MADPYDVHSAHLADPPTAAEMDAALRKSFGMTEETPIDTSDPAATVIAALTVPFRRDQISQRKIGGRMLDYVEGHEYITRLNEASPAWSFRMTKSDMQPLHVTRYDKQRQPYQTDLPCLVVHGELTIPGVGTRAGIGVQMIEDNAGEDVMKGALTDCLKNCAKYFGLGLHMYSGDAPAPAEPSGPSQAPARLSQVPPDHPSHPTQQRPAQRVTDAEYMAGQGPTERPRYAGGNGQQANPGQGKRTDQQGRDLWRLSGKNRDVIAEWCAPYGVRSDRDLTEAQAGEIITKYGGQ